MNEVLGLLSKTPPTINIDQSVHTVNNTTNTLNMTNAVTNTTNNTALIDARSATVLIPFDRPHREGGCIEFSLSDVREIISGEDASPLMREMCRKVESSTEPSREEAVAYTTALFTDILKVARRQNPACRNAYILPARQDQVRVYNADAPGADPEDPKTWERMFLDEAVRRIFDEISRQLKVRCRPDGTPSKEYTQLADPAAVETAIEEARQSALDLGYPPTMLDRVKPAPVAVSPTVKYGVERSPSCWETNGKDCLHVAREASAVLST